MKKIEITKKGKITRFASGKKESGRLVITDQELASLVSDEKVEYTLIINT